MACPPIPFLRVQETWYPWYQISSIAPECLASKLYYDELDLPVLVKLSSALPGLKLVCRVLLGSGRVLNDSDQVPSSPLKTQIGASNRCTY
jgi:hypothetical protein